MYQIHHNNSNRRLLNLDLILRIQLFGLVAFDRKIRWSPSFHRFVVKILNYKPVKRWTPSDLSTESYDPKQMESRNFETKR